MDISASILLWRGYANEQTISGYFSHWLEQHPYLAWSIAHPIPSLAILLLAIFSLWGLIKAIGRGIEQIWLYLLKTPFRLLQPIFRLIWRSIARRFGHTSFSGIQLTANITLSPAPERIEWIVDRLQTLSQEQELLLRELSTLMSSSVQSETRSLYDTKDEKL